MKTMKVVESIQKVQIFHYMDYREFLKDWLDQARQSYTFSYRNFARKAGFRSASTFKLVMDGKRNLTEESVRKFIRGMSLNAAEAEYFTHLVFFNQAENHDQKNQHYQKLLCSQELNKLRPVSRDQYDYYATWYHPVVRELVIAPNYDGTYGWIANRINPSISNAQVAASIELLQRMNLIEPAEPNEKSIWKQASPLVTSGRDASQIPLFNYYRSILELVSNQMTKVQADRRDVSALTMGIARSRFPLLKKKIEEFRSEILKLVSNETQPEEVVLLSIQLLPLTHSLTKGNKS